MSRLRTLWARVKGQAAQRRADKAFADEIREHITLLEQRYRTQGMSGQEATQAARRQFGNVTSLSERQRAQRGILSPTEWWRDVQFGLRMLRKKPGFAAIAIGSLALGIGANTVIFTAAQHMLLDQLVVPHPEQLRLLWWTQPDNNGVVEYTSGWGSRGPDGAEMYTSFSYPVYRQLRAENHSMEELFAFKPLYGQTVMPNGKPETLDTEMVSGNYFSALGVRPELGREIDDADDGAPGSGAVAVISDRYWTTHFGRAADVIGRTLLVNTVSLTIVGVAPKEFTGAFSAQSMPDLFFPMSMQPIVAPPDYASASLLTNNDQWWVMVMGRRKEGVPERKAAAELNVTMDAAVRATMTVNGKVMPQLLLRDGSRGQDPAAGRLTKPIYVLLALAAFVLLLACANLANLLLAQTGARQRELSIRLAIGATRQRILRQVMTESMILSLAGGAAGLLLAYLVRNTIPSLLADAWAPPAFAARFDWRILGFAIGISVLTGLVFGLGPAWAATRVEVNSGLKDTAHTVTNLRKGLAGRGLVVLQVALSMVLVVGAGLFVRTLMELTHTHLGFVPDRISLFGLAPPQKKYPKAATIPLYRAIEEKLATTPGVYGAAVTRIPLISGGVSMHTFVPEGTPRKKDGENPSVLTNEVGKDFFAMYEIPILAGRDFDATDTESSRKVAVVNEALAKKYFPNANPIGKTFEVGYKDTTVIEIVGICGNAKYARIRQEVEPTYYTPYVQMKDGSGWISFSVKTRMDGAEIASAIRRAVESVDPNLPVLGIHTEKQQIDATMRNERIFAVLTGVFGVLALVLASIGIYGMLAYSVSRRTSEIGIRMALGARPVMVLRMVLREAAWMMGMGIVMGLGAALGIGRLIASLLYGLKAWDPATLAGAAGLLAGTALAASWIPALRAARVDPMRALRHE